VKTIGRLMSAVSISAPVPIFFPALAQLIVYNLAIDYSQDRFQFLDSFSRHFCRIKIIIAENNKIAQLATGPGGPFPRDVPQQEVVIQDVRLVEAK